MSGSIEKDRAKSRRRQRKEVIGCTVNAAIWMTVIAFVSAKAIMNREPSHNRSLFAKQKECITPSEVQNELSAEQITQVISQLNEKLKPYGYAVSGHNLVKSSTQVSGALQTLPIDLETHRKILTEAKELYIDPVVGETPSPVIPTIILSVLGPDQQFQRWWLIKAETVLQIADQRLTQDEIEIFSRKMQISSANDLSIDDCLFISAEP